MVKRIGTSRSKTRHKLQKHRKDKGKISLRKFFQGFNEGDRVQLMAEPAVHGGMYFPRFHSKIGTISGKQGNCYKVAIKDFTKAKTLIVHPIHLRRV